MAVAYGANAKCYLKRQTDDETPATGNFTQIQFMSNDFGSNQNLGEDDVLGAGIGRDGGDPFLETLTADGTLVVPLLLDSFGLILAGLFGAPTTTGTTDKTHEFRSGATALPAWSLEKAMPDVPKFDLGFGVKFNTLAVDVSPTGGATASVGLIGLGETTATTSAAGTPTILAGQRFQKPSGSIKKDGVQLARVTGGSINFSNGMAGVQTVRPDNRQENVDLGKTSASGDLRMRLADNSLYAQAIAGTPAAMAYGFQISATKSVEFQFPRTFFSRPKIGISGSQGIELPVQWRASFDTTAGYMCRVLLKNQVMSYAA